MSKGDLDHDGETIETADPSLWELMNSGQLRNLHGTLNLGDDFDLLDGGCQWYQDLFQMHELTFWSLFFIVGCLAQA